MSRSRTSMNASNAAHGQRRVCREHRHSVRGTMTGAAAIVRKMSAVLS
jgi:hypothetical protein